MTKRIKIIILIILLTLIGGLGWRWQQQSDLQAAQTDKITVPEEEATITAYENTLPSVVSIVIVNRQFDSGNVIQQDVGGGTGFFVSSDGYIITNKHVVADTKSSYIAITNQGKEYAASVLARDPLFDIAIVKIEGSGFKPIKLGDSNKVRIGQTVLTIGNVLAQLQNTVTRGIISGTGRTIVAAGNGIRETIEDTIQTDASINPGNSGGPLINLKGEVIGINTAIDRSGESLGFAIPINRAKQAYDIFRKKGDIIRSFLGVRYVMLNRAVAQTNNLPYITGAYILKFDLEGNPGIVAGGPADKAGLLSGDIILELNKQKVLARTLGSMIADLDPGSTITLKILRNGTEKIITAVLGERKID